MTEVRDLMPMDEGHAFIPFAYEGNIMGQIREDQVPRFLGALTDTASLPTKTFKFNDLTAIQNRINLGKVKAIQESGSNGGKKPLVVSVNGRLYIGDGHHRAVALWMNGEDQMEAHYKDLGDEMSNAVKSSDLEDIEIIKVDEEHRVVYGWASVITEKGQPVIDTQGDIIEPDELVSATTEYMKGARVAKHNHRGEQIGEVLHSFPMTFEISKSLGIDTNGREGWLTGMYIKDDAKWEKAKSGVLKAFSIGARAVRVPVG